MTYFSVNAVIYFMVLLICIYLVFYHKMSLVLRIPLFLLYLNAPHLQMPPSATCTRGYPVLFMQWKPLKFLPPILEQLLLFITFASTQLHYYILTLTTRISAPTSSKSMHAFSSTCRPPEAVTAFDSDTHTGEILKYIQLLGDKGKAQLFSKFNAQEKNLNPALSHYGAWQPEPRFEGRSEVAAWRHGRRKLGRKTLMKSHECTCKYLCFTGTAISSRNRWLRCSVTNSFDNVQFAQRRIALAKHVHTTFKTR